MDREDLFRLAQATEDDDTQVPEDVLKALIKVAAGKAGPVKEMSEWLTSRLGNSESPRVKLLSVMRSSIRTVPISSSTGSLASLPCTCCHRT